MSRLFILFVLIVVGVVGLGFYRGWWRFASDSTGTKVHLNVTVDKDKIQEDKQEALEKVQDLRQELYDKVTTGTEESKDDEVHHERPHQN